VTLLVEFNQFLKEQKEAPGEAKLTVELFDSQCSFYVLNADIRSVDPLNEKSYSPSGNTALYDAIGKAIDETGTRLAAYEAESRPAKVIFAILTDGEENSSREYDKKKIFDMIKKTRDTLGWEFIYLAAGAEAFKGGADIGMNVSKMALYRNDNAGNTGTYTATSSYVTSLRSAVDMDQFKEFSMSNNMQAEVNAAVLSEENKDPAP